MTERRVGHPMGHAVSVPLDEDESVLYQGYTMLRGMGGELFLTTKRLIWIKFWLRLPFGRKLVAVPLSDIEGWTVERGPWWVRIDWIRPGRRVVRVRTIHETLDFVTVWTRRDADEWAEALENVMAEAQVARGKAHT